MRDYGADILRQLVAEGVARYPAEACGLVFEGSQGLRAELLENVIDRYHARDPVRFPRNAKTGYFIDPRVQLQSLERAEQRGERLCAIFHSHCDVGAYFSAEDRAMALTDEGEPLLPGVEYLVLSIRGGRCDHIFGIRFATGQPAQERSLELPGGDVPHG